MSAINAVLPVNCLAIALGYCNKQETAILSRVNKAFAELFRQDLGLEALQEQITGCTALTSMKDLRVQASRLTAFGIESTISDVLKRYHLKKVDFSQYELIKNDLVDLPFALSEVQRCSSLDIRHLAFKSMIFSQGALVSYLAFCPRLEHLQISCGYNLYVFLLEHFSKNSPTLKHFEHGHPYELALNHQGVIQNFIRNQPHLTYFSYPTLRGGLLTEIVNLLADSCPDLTNLSLDRGFDDEDLKRAVLHFAEKHPNLHTLDCSDLGHRYPQYTAELITDIGKVCKNIKSLRFDVGAEHSSPLIDDRVIEAALDVCPKLESFFLRNAPLVTDKSFTQFSLKWPSLKELHLSWCDSASSSAIFNILKDCRQLKTIVFTGIQEGNSDAQIYLQLRFLTQKLKEKNMLGIDFVKECQKLDPWCLKLLQRSIWVHDGMPVCDRYGERTLQENPEKIKKMTKPFISVQGGNLVEQLEKRQLAYLNISLINDELSVLRKVKDDLYKRKAQCQELCDLDKLETFQALLKDPEVTQPQLVEFYKHLPPHLQKKVSDPSKTAGDMK